MILQEKYVNNGKGVWMWVGCSMEGAVLNRIVWMGHTEKMTLELKLEGGEDVSYVLFWGKSKQRSWDWSRTGMFKEQLGGQCRAEWEEW